MIPVQFALTPARIRDQLLDYNKTSDVKLFYKAVEPLENKFDLSPENLRAFLKAVLDRAKLVNWTNTLIITVGASTLNLVRNYGSLSHEQVRLHALAYSGQQNRHMQNSAQIYECLSHSLTKEAHDKVDLETAKYMIGDEQDGLLYFKVIMSLAQVDTRATVSVIRTSLSSLDSKMIEYKDDVKAFNRFVKSQVEALTARGERSDDLLNNILKAYKACGDEGFKLWITLKELSYNEGENFTPEELMSLADNMYQSQIDAGTWHKVSESQRKIVALTAQIQGMESKGKPSGQRKDDKKDPKSQRGKESKGNQKNGKKRNVKTWDEPAWMTEAPVAGQPQDKDVDGKDYHWCKHHDKSGKWVRHLREKCEVKKALDLKAGKPPKPAAAPKAMMVNAAMISVLPEDDDY